jgi:hypothetical protein
MERNKNNFERKGEKMSKTTEAVIKTTGTMIMKLSVESAWSKNMLSLLRKSIASGEEEPEILGWLFTEIPEEISGKNGQMSYAESANYLALCIFANVRKETAAERTMIQAMKSIGMDRSSLMQVELSENLEDMRMPLFMLTQYIVSKGGAFSYPLLARDLYLFQFDKMQVIRKWEREFAREENK